METRNEALRSLRKAIGLTQERFAIMVGVSKDAVTSWEVGRNKITPKSAQAIRITTGVSGSSLLKGKVAEDDFGKPYSRATFEAWHSRFFGSNSKEAKRLFKQLAPWLELLFDAAAKPGHGGVHHRLPALYQSLLDWMEGARVNFQLEKETLKLLKERGTRTEPHEFTVAKLRKHKPLAAFYGYKDDKRFKPSKVIKIKMETWPGWSPAGPCPRAMKVATKRP